METNNKNQVYIKSQVELHEYNMHNYIYHLNVVNTPKPIWYDIAKKRLVIEQIPAMSVADMYGEHFSAIPLDIIREIRNIIKTLKIHNIIYPDITGYNFIKYNNQVYIIDFEHARFGFGPEQSDHFVDNFINNYNSWNPDFK